VNLVFFLPLLSLSKFIFFKITSGTSFFTPMTLSHPVLYSPLTYGCLPGRVETDISRSGLVEAKGRRSVERRVRRPTEEPEWGQ